MFKTNVHRLILTGVYLWGCHTAAPKGEEDTKSETRLAPIETVAAPPEPIEATKFLTVNVRTPGQSGGTLHLSCVGAPKSLNPILANENISSQILNPIYETCFSFDYREQELRPSLCEMVEQNEAGTEFTYTLRTGLKWSDGTPLTSDDIEFSYAVLSDPKIGSSARDLFLEDKDSRGRQHLPTFEKLNARKFRFKLRRVNQQFHLVASTMPIIAKHRWANVYADGTLAEHSLPEKVRLPLVGSGPFFLEQYERGESLILKRNPYYWKQDQYKQRLPYLNQIHFHPHRDFITSLVRFGEGETQLHNVRAAEYGRLMRKRQQAQWQLIDLGPSHATNYLMFNLDPIPRKVTKRDRAYRRRWFKRTDFRRAISHAIDRESIVRNILWGRGQPLWSYNSPADRRWSTDRVKRFPFDLAKAERKLKGLGFKKRGQTLVDKRGVNVEFSVLTNAENGARVAMLQQIQKDLARIGIRINVEPKPFVEVLEHLEKPRDFDAILLGWGADVPSDPMFSKNVLFSSGQDHLWAPSQGRTAHTKWEAKIDELLRRNLASQHYETRKPLMDKIQVILSEQLPQIPLVVEYLGAAADVRVGNFEPYALDGGLYWNLEQLYLRQD